VACFCTARPFLEGIAPCIAQVCISADQVQTERYAKAICSAAGVTLPSFQELLEVQKADKASDTTSALLTSTTAGNHTAPKSSTDSTTSSTISATASAIVSNSPAASGSESGVAGLTVKMGVTGTLVAAGIGLGMFLV
jgi:hypothetical protein